MASREKSSPSCRPLLDGLDKLWNRCLTVAVVVAAFHRQRVLPLMARRWRLFEMRPDDSIVGIRLSASALSDEEILCRVREAVDAKLRSGGLTTLAMHPSQGFLSLVSRAPLQPPSPLRFSLFLVPLCAFAVPAGDEGRVSLPAVHSRGREAAGNPPGACRGVEKMEGRQGGEAQEADSCTRETRRASSAAKEGRPPVGGVPIAVAINGCLGRR